MALPEKTPTLPQAHCGCCWPICLLALRAADSSRNATSQPRVPSGQAVAHGTCQTGRPPRHVPPSHQGFYSPLEFPEAWMLQDMRPALNQPMAAQVPGQGWSAQFRPLLQSSGTFCRREGHACLRWRGQGGNSRLNPTWPMIYPPLLPPNPHSASQSPVCRLGGLHCWSLSGGVPSPDTPQRTLARVCVQVCGSVCAHIQLYVYAFVYYVFMHMLLCFMCARICLSHNDS